MEPKHPLIRFIAESNKIESIHSVSEKDLKAHDRLLCQDKLCLEDIVRFVQDTAEAELRERSGMNVRVGDHFPPKGGEKVKSMLLDLIKEINELGCVATPNQIYRIHCRYLYIHPFTDGNGRSARAIWLWMMKKSGVRMAGSFLQTFYYQSLGNFDRLIGKSIDE